MSLKKRKYSETYLKFGFTFTINNGLDIPVCVLCQKSLGNGSMKPSPLTGICRELIRNSKTTT